MNRIKPKWEEVRRGGCAWYFFDGIYYGALVTGIITAIGVPLWNLFEFVRHREPEKYVPWWLLLAVPALYGVMLVSIRLRNRQDKNG